MKEPGKFGRLHGAGGDRRTGPDYQHETQPPNSIERNLMNSTTNYDALRQAALLAHGVQVLIASMGKPRDAVRDIADALAKIAAKESK